MSETLKFVVLCADGVCDLSHSLLERTTHAAQLHYIARYGCLGTLALPEGIPLLPCFFPCVTDALDLLQSNYEQLSVPS